MLAGLFAIWLWFGDGGVVVGGDGGVVGWLSDERMFGARCLVRCLGVCRIASTGDVPSVKSDPCGRRFDLHIVHPEPLDRRTGKSLESNPSCLLRGGEK